MATLLAVLAGCGGDESPDRIFLATGLTEFDPATLTGPRGRALRPRYARVYVLWSAVQPAAGARPDWDVAGTGGFGARAQLRAVRAVGAEPVVTFFSTPAWAAQPPLGCEPPRPNVNARAPRADALPAYRALVAGFLRMARAEDVDVRYLSAWNEPNSGLFLAPQRGQCAVASPAVGAAAYTALVRSLRAALDAAPGEQEIVLGETSSPYEPRPIISSVNEFLTRLPRDVLCAGDVWAQHQYAGDANGIAELKGLLARTPCAPRRIWVTETGAGARRPGAAVSRTGARRRAACRELHVLLRRWHRDRQVEIAFQFTLREDPPCPGGRAAPEGEPVVPTYALWRAWSVRGDDDPPPELPGECR
ncbi:MAG TPA: hypothetical protein VNB64_04405 [Solirubrobacteraceae bacterium]|nr:hypothetical protein [Solirubrobacteraceae bacterium]